MESSSLILDTEGRNTDVGRDQRAPPPLSLALRSLRLLWAQPVTLPTQETDKVFVVMAQEPSKRQ